MYLQPSREGHGQPGFLQGKPFDERNVDTAFGQTSQTGFAHRVVANRGMKGNAIRQKREIMREYCGKASECYAQIAREVLPVEFEFRRQAVQNEVEIQFAHDRDVKFKY